MASRAASRLRELCAGAWGRLEHTAAGRFLHAFVAMRAVDRALALASKLFIAVLPISILSTALISGRSFGDQLVERFGLSGAGAQAARTLFAAPAQVQTGIGLLGLVILASSMFSFTRALERTHLDCWQLPPAGAAALRDRLSWRSRSSASLGPGDLVDRQVLDNHSWRNASDEIIRDANVRSMLSTYLVDELYANVDIGAELEQRLPQGAGALAGPISAALRQPATDAVDKLLVAPRIQQLWTDSNGAAHQRLINDVENKTGFGIATGNGVVTVDLGKLVRQVGDELGLPAAGLDSCRRTRAW